MFRWFCKHKWEILSEIVLPSAFEQLKSAGDMETMQGRGASALFKKMRKKQRNCSLLHKNSGKHMKMGLRTFSVSLVTVPNLDPKNAHQIMRHGQRKWKPTTALLVN